MSSTPSQPTTPGPVGPPRLVRCESRTRSGLQCRFPARPGRHYCINHDDEYRAQQFLNRLSGVAAATEARKRRARLRKETAVYDLDEWALADRASIQALLDAVIRLEFAGRLPNHRARNIIRALAIAARNFDTPPLDTGKARTSRHNLNRYRRTRQTLDAQLESLCQEAESRDQARHPE